MGSDHGESSGDLDAEVNEGWRDEPAPTSHLRSREEYIREVRAAMERWLPGVPLPQDLRSPAPTSDLVSKTSEVASNISGSKSVRDSREEPEEPQDRGHPDRPDRRALHSFRSVPAMHAQPGDGHAIGVGYVVLTLREVGGLSQRRLASAAGTSQGAISRVESGNHVPSLPSLFRLANAVGYRLVLGFAAPEVATLDPATVEIDDLALVGMLVRDPTDGLPCFRVLREPPPWAGPR